MDKILNNLSSATTPYDVSGNSSGNGLISVFGRFNYQLMEKYLFTFTARFDGSSKFGSHNKYGFFPSGAFAWKIDQEPFMKDIEEVNELKLRLSAGVTGTQNTVIITIRIFMARTIFWENRELSRQPWEITIYAGNGPSNSISLSIMLCWITG